MSDSSSCCPDCGQALQIGDWPHCPHGSVTKKSKLFTGYYDIALETTIESAQQLDRTVRQRNLVIRNNEHLDDINHRRDRLGMPPARL